MKAGALCVFSPPGGIPASRKDVDRPFVSNHSNLPSSAGIYGSELPAALDWSFLHPSFGLTDASTYTPLGDLAGQPGPGLAAPLPGSDPPCRPEDEATATDPKPSPPNSKSHCTQQLASIMVDLDALWAEIPPTSAFHFPLGDDIEKHTAAFAEKYAQHKSIENLFGTSQRLIDLYPAAILQSLTLNSMDPPRCETGGCVHSVDPPPSLRAAEESVLSRNSSSAIDHSLASLLISCHLRLLDVLDHLLLLVLSCFKIHSTSPTMREPDFGVPELRVGSFTPPRASAAFMQAFLAKHLVGILSEKAGQLAQAVELKSGENPDKECRVLALQCELLKERQAVKLDQIGAVGEELVKSGMLK